MVRGVWSPLGNDGDDGDTSPFTQLASMSDMRTLLKQLVEDGSDKWGVALVVGAGAGAELPLLRQLGAQHMVLVEAHPRQAEALARRTDAAKGEHVLAVAVTGEPVDSVALHVFNNPHFSSLAPPTRLGELLPNLRIVEEIQVPARTLDELIAELAVDDTARNLLVIDAPGQAGALLGKVSIAALHAFSDVIVRSAVEPLYADDTGMQELLGTLLRLGFESTGDDPEAIYPLAATGLRRDDATARLLDMESMLAKVTADGEARESTLRQRDAQVEQLTKAAQVAAKQALEQKALIEQLVSKRDDLVGQLAKQKLELMKIATDRDAQVAQLTKTAQAAAEQALEQKNLIEQLASKRDDLAGRLAEQKLELDKVTQIAAQQQKLSADRQETVERLNKQNQERTSRVSQLEAERVEFEQRQIRLSEEMIKAEAQVDLIKDILLRDAGL